MERIIGKKLEKNFGRAFRIQNIFFYGNEAILFLPIGEISILIHLFKSTRMTGECSSVCTILTTGMMVNAGIYLCIPLIQIHVVSTQIYFTGLNLLSSIEKKLFLF